MNHGLGNASWLELAWLASGLIAYRFSIRTHRRAKSNEARLKKAGVNGRYILAARRNVREETIRVLKSVTIVAVGLIACATPPATTHSPWTVTAITVTAGLFLISGLITWGAISSSRYYDDFDRIERDRRRRATDQP